MGKFIINVTGIKSTQKNNFFLIINMAATLANTQRLHLPQPKFLRVDADSFSNTTILDVLEECCGSKWTCSMKFMLLAATDSGIASNGWLQTNYWKEEFCKEEAAMSLFGWLQPKLHALCFKHWLWFSNSYTLQLIPNSHTSPRDLLIPNSHTSPLDWGFQIATQVL